MKEAFLHIGIAQALFTAIIVLTKRPLSIQDKILSIWLFFIAILLGNTYLHYSFPDIPDDRWMGAGVNFLVIPPFFFLYISYSTKKHLRFKSIDFLHFAPVLVFVLISTVLYRGNLVGADKPEKVLKVFFGAYFIFSSLTYAFFAFRMLRKYDEILDDEYSFHLQVFNLKWARYISIGFAASIVIFAIVGSLRKNNIIVFNPMQFLIGAFIIFTYAISFFGFRQFNVMSFQKSIGEEEKTENKSERYQKSGLKDEDAEKYLKTIIDFMDKEQPWKNPQLAAPGFAQLTKIPKHYITQILNEKLNKNFYTFVNEYRTEKAKEMLVSIEYKAWSIVAIAYECGFNSKSAFNSFFKKHTGITPSEFKNQKT